MACYPCRAGERVSFDGSWSGMGGIVTIDGDTFSTGGAFDPLDTLTVSTRAFTVPMVSSEPIDVWLPFGLTYSIGPDFQVMARG